MSQTQLAAQAITGVVVSLLNTGLYALALFLSFSFVRRINFKDYFVTLTPLLGLVLVLLLTSFIISPLTLIFNKLFDPLINPGKGFLHPLEGLFLVSVLWYIRKNFSKGGDN